MLPTITRRSFRPFYVPNFFDDDFFPMLSNSTKSSVPAVNIREDDKNYVLDFAIPGIDKKDLKIDMNEDVLTISSEVKNESEDSKNDYKRKEFSYTAFSRSFNIPDNVDREKIGANYKDGVLTVSLPKQEEEKNKISKTIEIS
jgi:HSP20 family protein